MTEKKKKDPIKKESKKKERSSLPAAQSEDGKESKWQDFLRRHSNSKEKKN